MLSAGLCAQLACIWEATARKPGNVHRYRDFEDATYLDFIVSAAACAPVLESARGRPVGQTILEGVRATRQVARTNTNLGILLLLAPLAAVPEGEPLRDGLRRILGGLSVEDARAAYEAIRLANPSGLGRVAEQDVAEEPTQTLLQAMSLAADRDLIALQYVNGFAQIFEEGVPALRRALEHGVGMERAIIACQLNLLARHPDSLIARKRGPEEAAEVSRRAGLSLANGWEAIKAFDAWLREEGHTRNPGTTADLVAACLFVALAQGWLSPPASV